SWTSWDPRDFYSDGMAKVYGLPYVWSLPAQTAAAATYWNAFLTNHSKWTTLDLWQDYGCTRNTDSPWSSIALAGIAAGDKASAGSLSEVGGGAWTSQYFLAQDATSSTAADCLLHAPYVPHAGPGYLSTLGSGSSSSNRWIKFIPKIVSAGNYDLRINFAPG